MGERSSGGYNAALLRELVGPAGSVTSIDIDPYVVERARACLVAAGVDGVRVECGDGEYGAAAYAPYDRIIVTAGAWDVPPAWLEQLADGGRLVVPLRLRILTRSVAFDRRDGWLAGGDYRMCGFVAVQGAGAHPQRQVALAGREVQLAVDDVTAVDADLLAGALATPRVQGWSQVSVGGREAFDDLDLWLSTVEPGFGFLTAGKLAVEGGLVAPVYPWGAVAIHNRDSVAHLAKRPTGPAGERFELGVHAYGRHAGKLADRLVDHIQTWGRERRGRPPARIGAYPRAMPDDRLPAGLVLTKQHMKITITWP